MILEPSNGSLVIDFHDREDPAAVVQIAVSGGDIQLTQGGDRLVVPVAFIKELQCGIKQAIKKAGE